MKHFLQLAGILILLSAHAVLAVSPGGSCNATTILGIGACSANCPPGSTPICEGGVFSTSCTCKPDGSPVQAFRQLPSITPMQLDLAQQFSAWARGTGSPGLAQLADLADNSRAALIAQNAPAFSMAEDQVWQTWQQLPPPDQSAIVGWQQAHGIAH